MDPRHAAAAAPEAFPDCRARPLWPRRCMDLEAVDGADERGAFLAVDSSIRPFAVPFSNDGCNKYVKERKFIITHTHVLRAVRYRYSFIQSFIHVRVKREAFAIELKRNPRIWSHFYSNGICLRVCKSTKRRTSTCTDRSM